MTEESAEYKVDPDASEITMAAQIQFPELWDKLKQLEEGSFWNAEEIIRTRYYQEVSEFAKAIVESGITPASPEAVVITAIEITDLLIQAVKEKTNDE